MVTPKTGVYRIRHLESGKCYVGSAAQLFSNRWSAHRSKLRQHKHHCPPLQNAWNKYGSNAFVFEVLLYCDPKDCLMYEQIALDYFKPEYNVNPQARSSSGRRCKDSTKKKIGQANLGKHLGERNPSAKLNQLQVNEIRSKLKDGIPGTIIANQLGIAKQTVSAIKLGHTWSEQ